MAKSTAGLADAVVLNGVDGLAETDASSRTTCCPLVRSPPDRMTTMPTAAATASTAAVTAPPTTYFHRPDPAGAEAAGTEYSLPVGCGQRPDDERLTRNRRPAEYR